MAKIKKSIIVTSFNEEETIQSLAKSILSQSEMPDEVVIVDGGSLDKTVIKFKSSISKSKYKNRFKIFKKRGNRSIGRNEAIKRSKAEIIAITDAGCLLDPNWFKNVTKPFVDSKIDVVAGYYKARTYSIFQRSLVPYVFVMPDRVNPKTFLPATRSMAIKKSVWKDVGKFDEKLSNNEDHAFARNLKSKGFNIKFVKNAIVFWIPRNNLKQAFVMFFRFALGDSEAGILRPKVIFLFLRYFIALFLLLFEPQLLVWLFPIYIIWSVNKNYKYVKDWRAFILLPLLQLVSDFAVISGSIIGIGYLFSGVWKSWAKKVNNNIKPWQHFNILASSFVISISIFLFITFIFPVKFDVNSTSINWYTVHNYPKQMDYFYFEFGFIFISFFTILLWIIKIWTKIKE